MTETEQIQPTPFPARSFIAISGVWLLMDMIVMYVLWQAPNLVYDPSLLIPVWTAVLAAKFMLLLGWLMLGEGRGEHRLLGGLLFFPLVVPFLFDPDALCFLLGFLVVVVPLSAIFCLPYLLLYVSDYRLGRDALPMTSDPSRQFTVRQLMVVTLVAAVVMGLMRWTKEAELHEMLLVLLIPLLGWVAPLALTAGLLFPRLYPHVLYAVGVSVYLLAQPWLVFATGREADGMAIFITTYVLFFAAHVLLLRWLGFRLLIRRRVRMKYPDLGIVFLDPQPEPGISFFDSAKNPI